MPVTGPGSAVIIVGMTLPDDITVVPLPHPADPWLVEGMVQVTREAMLADAGDDDGAPTVRELAELVLPTAYRRRPTVVALDGRAGERPSAVVGHGYASLPLTDNLHLALVGVAVRPAHRRRGIGAALWEQVLATVRAEGRTTCLAATEHPADVPADPALRVEAATGSGVVGVDAATRFLQARGFALAQVERRSRLEVPMGPDDAERLAAMVAAGRERQVGYDVVSWHGRVPDRWLGDVAELFRRMSTDVPLGELDHVEEVWDAARVRTAFDEHAARGLVPWVSAIRHVATDTLVAFTVLLVPDERPEIAYQEDTIVMVEHRGRRLGAWVKQANYLNLTAGDPACGGC
ncbi:GNAT family N-acetyltransferase [Serinibacter arcticus]|uniref:GNAT family N-acetyltransferase n=1 Tax=Serinibacter arcticus TaxID=1655435 RepID=A0A2U1ZV04_9MICO|nr:GNAT family N-acetyltransferase [Serinibacter arcticus]PWD50827.1 GNAT family N-acetyltransferase [Serinibacter arcticus]